MKKLLISLFSLSLCAISNGQALFLSFPEETVLSGETIDIPLLATGFDSIVSMQFSINWDEAVIEYVDVELTVLPLFAVGEVQAPEGKLRISWFDDTGSGQSFPNETAIAIFRFTAIGNVGDITPIDITSDPLAIEIFKATSVEGIFEPIPHTLISGSVEIVDELELGFSPDITGVSCFGEMDGTAIINLSVDTIDFSLNWEDESGMTFSGFQQNNLAPGIYSLGLLDGAGTLVINTQITIPGPEQALSMSAPVLTMSDCNTPDGSATIVASGGTTPYIYQLGEQTSNTGIFEMLSGGEYPLLITDDNNCTIQDTIIIESLNAIELIIPDTLALCNNETLTVSPGAVGNYIWSTGETNDSINISIAGQYSLTVTNAQNCEASATFEVIASSALNPQLETDFPEACPGDSLQLLVSGGETYEWLNFTTTLSATNVPNPIVFPDSSNIYRVAISNTCAADTLEVPVHVFEITATAGPDTCIALGEELLFYATGGLFYEWEENSFPVSDPTIPNPLVMPEDSSTYIVNITDINGCITNDEVLVLVVDNPIDFILPINFISPNGDGFNDVLDFGYLGKYGNNSLKVYNRWGDLVYQKLNYQTDEERFDGTYNDKPLPAGNYFYVLSFKQGSLRQTLSIVREL